MTMMSAAAQDIMLKDFALPHGVTLACRGQPAHRLGAPRVLYLHGFPEAAFIWDEVMQRLAPHAQGLAPNLRGFAGSSRPADVAAYRPKHLVADIVALVQAWGGPLDLLVAHDWGGAVAWNLAAQHPGLMKRLLIINSPHPAPFLRELRHNAAQQAASAYMNFLCRPDAAKLLAADDFRRLWRLFGDAAWLTPALRQQYRSVWGSGGQDLEGALNYYRASPLRPAIKADDLIHTLELPDDSVTVRVPTTVLWGEQDIALLPGLLHGLSRWVPELQVQRVPDASHWLVHEQPALVASVVQRLL
jgi:epoxide hydrolase 4